MITLKCEEEIIKIEEEIENLKKENSSSEKIAKFEDEKNKKIKEVYEHLTPIQKLEIARWEKRPHTLDYIENLIKDFVMLSGDRCFSEDAAIVAGIGTFENIPVMIIGHEKGRNTEERIKHHFGLAKAEGYRKAIRLMKTADKLNLPIISFIDTSGAYPGAESEERGVHEAIAKSMQVSFDLKVPFISIIIGEGGSGGAIAIAVANKVLMLENSYYSTISPEGLASILWRSQDFKEKAAEVSKATADDLLFLGVIDEIINEGLGGAHRNKKLVFENTKKAIKTNLDKLLKLSPDELVKHRRMKFQNMGK